MRPGRMKYKARARRRRVAVTAAGVSALTVLGGTAYASESQSRHHEDPEATLKNGGDAKAIIEQESEVETAQLALANTGANEAVAVSGNVNLGFQECTSDLSGGDQSNAEEENATGNEGGNCDNDALQGNHAGTKADIDTGDANSENEAHTTVHQTNSGGVDLNNTANENEVEGDDGDASLYNGGDAFLKVDQDSSVSTYQGAIANTGFNTAVAVGIGVNAGAQTASSGNSGGNIDWADEGNTAGNSGGNASNHASQSNSGSTTAEIDTGNATASNSSTTTVNQTNSGGASSTNTANGNKVSTD
jgi:hypothetical protein